VAAGFGRHGMPRPPLTLTFDGLTLNLVCESHLRWESFVPNLGTLYVFGFSNYSLRTRRMDRQTDGQKTTLFVFLPYDRGHNSKQQYYDVNCIGNCNDVSAF